MQSKEQKYRDISEQLSQMPPVSDPRAKEDVKQQILSQFNQEERKRDKKSNRNRWVPLLSTLLATAILIFVSFLFYNNYNIPQNDVAESGDSMRYASEEEAAIEESAEQESTTQSDETMEANNTGMFVQQKTDQSTVVHGATSDPQLQYVIPISFIVPEQNDKEIYYNELESYITEHVLTTSTYLFKGVTFEINEENNEVILDLPKGFNVSEGSTVPNMFEDQLSAMFTPYGIQKAVFKNPGGVDLGQFGKITELPLTKTKTAYKLYSNDQDNLLVELPLKEYTTIEEAFMEMQNGDEDFDVFSTIPKDLDFSVAEHDTQLEITINNDVTNTNVRTSTIMVEAILMTAKSYGYELVKFHTNSGDELGYYDVSEVLQVPESVNPIMLP
ncbi:hypothetical protein [Oceanobacillus manasiensis]|uniref:hypothetical protein n=1 Tax=Oceanobacillus manasiensis TaxID=586413 RepID=UPI0005A745DF|nr:hypothetical protein [Oceanobacillus manasiensis]